MDRKSYESLKNVYTNSLGKLYERDLKLLFDSAKSKISGSLHNNNNNKENNDSVMYFFQSFKSSNITNNIDWIRSVLMDTRDKFAGPQKLRINSGTGAHSIGASMFARTTILREFFSSNI